MEGELMLRTRIVSAVLGAMVIAPVIATAPATAAPVNESVSASVKKANTFACHDGRTYTNNGTIWSFGGGRFGLMFGSNGGRTAIRVFNYDGSTTSTKFIIKDYRPGGAVVQGEGTGTSYCQVMGDNSQGYEAIAKRNGNTWKF